ncbi:hypothetical protein AT959_08605 [Dechloromonas denitrificans]|uniref:Uncharacterized protein n=1 Tax=Dechloromonas denitrificans TaxID=281362 RepID=A0A133XIL1_9RHOO|nr:hypothetical protein AT959_08605 [Dechloromonas denitrificans]
MASLTKTFRREYDALRWAIRWCTDQMHPNFQWYGGRGITVCPEWTASFAAFLMHVGPKPKHSRLLWLGRLDVNKGYEPGNVAWLPHQRQITHRRYCRRMQFEGQELTLEEISRELGLAPGGLRTRIVRLEMAPAKALTSGPVQYRKTAVLLTHNGQTMSLPEWARKVGIRREKLRNRLDHGWPLEKALQPGDFRRKPDSSL